MDKNQPLVSIITPSFNQAEYLEATIRSVLEQDYPRIEYIIADGGSSDGSVEIIEKYADQLAWWVSEKDDGQSDAINKGMKRAKGEIIAWLNSDDVYQPGAVKAAVDSLLANPDCGMVYADLHSIDSAGKVFHTITYQQFSTADLLAMNIIGQPTVFMRKDILEQAGFLDESFHYLMDHHLWLRMSSLANMQYVPQTWAAARHHSGAKNTAQGIKFAAEAQKLLDWAKTQPLFKELAADNQKKIQAGHLLFEAYYLLDDGQNGTALSHYIKALLKHPPTAFNQIRRLGRILLALLGIQAGASKRAAEKRRPLLVAGGHRSGTTWVGKMLAHSRRYAYISEPLNRYHRKGVLNAKVPHWYLYICDDNGENFLEPFRKTLALNYNLSAELLSIRSPKDIGRMVRDFSIFMNGKLQRKTPLLKDPFALFSLPWFIEKLNCDAVIVIRHPAAYVSSLVRLGWFNVLPDLLAQPLLVRDGLLSFQHRLLEELEKPTDPVVRAALFWCVLADTAQVLKEKFPDRITIVRHEDLSLDPLEAFGSLYQGLNLPFDHHARQKILQATSVKNPDKLANNKTHSVALNSKENLNNWKRLLSAEDIDRIKEVTQDQSTLFYSPEDWL